MKLFNQAAFSYALGGALFGLCFPIIATLVELNVASSPINTQAIINIQQKNPLLWIINTAPFFLGLFAFFIGRQIDRLKEKNQQIQDAQSQIVLQEQLASIGKMTAGIAHEIKNPLNFIHNFAEGSIEIVQDLEEEIKRFKSKFDEDSLAYFLELTEDLRQNANDIKENSNRVNRIVFTLMDHTRGSKSEAQQTDINSLLDKNINLAYHSYRARYASFNMDIQKSYDLSIPKVLMSSHSLGRVLINIINNACYALNQKQEQLGRQFDPVLKLSTKQRDHLLKIEIEDNGNGIPDHIRKKIFDPFFTTKPTGIGNSGLGLSISKDIIQQEYHGTIDLESKLNHFTKFTISIPIKQRESKLSMLPLPSRKRVVS